MADLVVLCGALASAWGLTPGWGAVAYLPTTGETKKIVDPAFDPAAAGADVLPLAAAIQWYHYARRPKGHLPRVDVVTDSLELMIAAQDPLIGLNGSDWRFMRWFETSGYEIRWIFLGTLEDDVNEGIRRELASYARECQAALAGRLQRH